MSHRDPFAAAYQDVHAEFVRSCGLFPGNDDKFAALMEEVGELSQALLQHKWQGGSALDVWKEAIQVASCAARIGTTGDSAHQLEHDPRGPSVDVLTKGLFDLVPQRVEDLRSTFPGSDGNLHRMFRAAGRLGQLMHDCRGMPYGVTMLRVSCAQLAAHAVRIAVEGDANFPYHIGLVFTWPSDFATPPAARAADPSRAEAGGAAKASSFFGDHPPGGPYNDSFGYGTDND